MTQAKLRTSYLLIFPLLAIALASPAFSYDSPNRFNSLADSIFDMMDAFTSAYQRNRASPYSDFSNRRYGSREVPPEVALTGIWQGQGGEILQIRQGRFRILLDPMVYRDGFIEITSPHSFILTDLHSGLYREYEFAEDGGRLALRDNIGNMLLFIRLRRW